MLTRIANQLYIHVYQIMKSPGFDLYNSLRHIANRKFFSSLSLTQNGREVYMFHLAREGKGKVR